MIVERFEIQDVILIGWFFREEAADWKLSRKIDHLLLRCRRSPTIP